MITARTAVAGVIGSPVSHSLSPAIHNAAFAAVGLDWSFHAFEVAPGDAARALDGVRALGLRGLSVTMPHKEDVAGLVDTCSDDAAALGAVNCIVPRDGLLIGENTDGPGFIDALRDEASFDPAGRRCVVIGAGGAARAVVLALARAGASEVAVANRTSSRGSVAAALAGAVGRVVDLDAVAGADLIVNATPIGMVDDGLPLDPQRIGRGQLVADLIYHPAVTPLLAAASEQGALALNGLGMLVHQAARAFRCWTGEDPPVAAMRAAAEAELRRGHD
ncbi:MAG: shikimate dehydrogenase [Acidimicrobiaceae bacterium]